MGLGGDGVIPRNRGNGVEEALCLALYSAAANTAPPKEKTFGLDFKDE